MCTELETTDLCILRRYRGTSYAFSPMYPQTIQRNLLRLLTYVSSDDTEEPLTPSHLLTGRRVLSIPDEFATAEEDETDVQLLSRRRYFSKLLGQLWSRWKREYVVDLREHQRPADEGASVAQSVALADIVTVMEEGNRRT